MNKESDKPDSPTTDVPLRYAKAFLQRIVNDCNKGFNALSSKDKKATLMVFGILITTICTMLILNALFGHPDTSLSIHEITVPNDLHMNTPDTQKLIPIGKMKGEWNGEFEAFHVAVDRQGQLFINRNPEFSTDSLHQSKGWEPITKQRLETFEKQLHFIPTQRKGLKR